MVVADLTAVRVHSSTEQHVRPNNISVAYDGPATLTTPGIEPGTISTPSTVSTTRPLVLDQDRYYSFGFIVLSLCLDPKIHV